MCGLGTLELWGWCFAFLCVSTKYARYPVLCCSVWVETERLVELISRDSYKMYEGLVWINFKAERSGKPGQRLVKKRKKKIVVRNLVPLWLTCKPCTRYYYKDFSLICSVSISKYSRYSDSLQVGRSGDRIPLGGEIFRTRPDQPWCPPIQWVPGLSRG
jgi:hypothetical protein